MLKRLLIFLLFVSTPTLASHIVGGEFELLHVSGYNYRLRLILYFDELNGNPGARDNSATVRIFRKSDNRPMRDVFLPFNSSINVDYFQPECSNGEIVTDKLLYSAEIYLDPDVYSDPGGYYVAWERCCRNYSITNIFSDDPQTGGQYAGQTFYLEFPPVRKDGQRFINSSPELFPPLNDYACPGRPYWVDFAGTDADGDSLVYSLVTPRNTITAQAIPNGGPNPGPYPPINWQPGFGLNSITGGNPDLAISERGFLTVTPAKQGLFVFAVKCEEFREGEKIGEVIRDFQMLVLDRCPDAEPPVILGRKLEDPDFIHKDNLTIQFDNNTTDEDRCIQIQVTDPDALKADDDYVEQIWLQVIALDFLATKNNLADVLPEVTVAVLDSGNVATTFDICFDKCPLFPDVPYKLGIVAYDDACALPLTDTLRLDVRIQPPDNTSAYYTTSGTSVSMKEGDEFTWQIEGRDNEQDSLVFTVLTDGFDLADVGMSFVNTTNDEGVLSTTFKWETGCDIYDFTDRTNFQLKLVLEDLDECTYSDPAVIDLNLEVILPPNTDPVIGTDLNNLTILSKINNPINFNVFGSDSDGDDLELKAVPQGFTLEDYGISFPESFGNSQITSQFFWQPECGDVDLDIQRDFQFVFILNDLDKCKFPNYDSLVVDITLLEPDNRAPTIEIANLNQEIQVVGLEAELEILDLLRIEVQATDPDQDSLWLELIPNDSLPEAFTFEPAGGRGAVKSVLQWIPECRDLTPELLGKEYQFSFKVMDDVCYTALGDTLNFTVSVADILLELEKFIPTNVITPNNDGLNEYFEIPDLPVDNCAGQFQSVRIYNRWGTEVFVTTDRDFKWYGENVLAGQYYYVIDYTNKDFNGPISVLY